MIRRALAAFPRSSPRILSTSPIQARDLHIRHKSSVAAQRAVMATRYITPNELATIIKSDKILHKDYFIVDVRDDDYPGGNIKGSHNSPSNIFLSKVDALVEETKDVPIVVFHCALSQVRGPKAARIYAQTRAIMSYEGNGTPHEVLILRGGFSDFQAKFRDDSELVENWDKQVWGSEWS